nr:uncharacterized protein LOC105858937 [Microcebus murinus]
MGSARRSSADGGVLRGHNGTGPGTTRGSRGQSHGMPESCRQGTEICGKEEVEEIQFSIGWAPGKRARRPSLPFEPPWGSHFGITLLLSPSCGLDFPIHSKCPEQERNRSCRSEPWRPRGGGIKPMTQASSFQTYCMCLAFTETCICRVCVCMLWHHVECVCLRVCSSVSVCLSEGERKRAKWEQTGCLGIYVTHAERVQCCKADSHPSLDSAALEGLYRPDLNVKCRRRN